MGKNQTKKPQKYYMSTLALTMLNVVMIAGLANDPQQAFYGLSSVTYFAIGFILFFIPTALVSAELASGWPQRGGIFRWVGEGMGVYLFNYSVVPINLQSRCWNAKLCSYNYVFHAALSARNPILTASAT